jgi:hypothetical protein
MGTYVCEVTNPAVPGVVLPTNDKRVRAAATLSGKVMVDNTKPVSVGTILLFHINPVGTAYDTTAIKTLNNDGSYVFNQVVLDDYQLLSKPDAKQYSGYLPTYYDGKLFWEEADTVSVQNSMSNLNITVQAIPVPSTGTGSITGTVEEDVADARQNRVEGKRVVAGAEVSARRETAATRIEATTYVLAATTYTDANGQFTLPNLTPGTYLFNIQYPGFPMDASSAINITIGDQPSNKQVVISALVTGGKIVVTPIKITGVETDIAISAYPNPTKERLLISSNENALTVSQLEIHDMNGRTISLPVVTQKNGLEVDVRTLTRGLYILTILDSSGSALYSAKVSVE